MLIRMQYDILQASSQRVNALLHEMENEDELFASANTLRQIDWHGWARLSQLIEQDARPRREEIWYAIQSLLPATLALMTALRRREPVWFEIGF